MAFENIVGQNEVINVLTHAISTGRIGHACLFTGPAGIGKRTVAAEYARLLICEEPGREGVCGRCRACILYNEGSNPDFIRVSTESSTISVDEIREMQKDISIKPMYSKRKVYIIEEADKMTVQAQNCLLKTLEEPPEYAVIILTAANYDALLETIRSRTQRFTFKKNTYEEVCSVVDRVYKGNNMCRDFAVAFADGVIGTALKLAGESNLQELRDKTLALLEKLRSARLYSVFGEYAFFEDNKDDVDAILAMMSMYYRDIMVAKETGSEKMLINSDKKDIIFNNVPLFTVQKLIRNIEIIEEARKNLKQNANYQLTIENMLIKLQEETE